ncbi:sigma-70 family RNA polymerase sigma factor [Solirubrobacter sp. CPCC 204708]|uniref:Sigma-70 family RNA polymerase sigma factor n=1 Tax=Solirubrobacter deserti TaxID=2282478 RepID=A0ABT4RDA2_9ACTN|nr:sigma-70 family RNA polymerase sigma factor [Solirubrobacter deserti]MBE2317725.1 sigma-70 family RNA polymerase sigma factor [Solirubrobacter deserti]MDA0136498.1 sigma-70 family RNA polymerase sigma factor [Solirubrobacter deserti]
MATDEELLHRIAVRDERAFTELYRRHAVAASATARRVCREPEDVLQDAFFALWRDAAAFRPRPGGAAGWLHTIVRHRGIDHVRQAAVRERRCVLDERPLTGAVCERPAPDEVVTAREERARLRGAIAALPAEQREVIVLAYGEELTQREIAARLCVALGTVKGRTRLALRRLRLELS